MAGNMLLAIGIGITILVGLLVLLDLLLAHGAGTLDIMHDTAMIVGNPIGRAILIVLLVILGVLAYALSLR